MIQQLKDWVYTFDEDYPPFSIWDLKDVTKFLGSTNQLSFIDTEIKGKKKKMKKPFISPPQDSMFFLSNRISQRVADPVQRVHSYNPDPF